MFVDGRVDGPVRHPEESHGTFRAAGVGCRDMAAALMNNQKNDRSPLLVVLRFMVMCCKSPDYLSRGVELKYHQGDDSAKGGQHAPLEKPPGTTCSLGCKAKTSSKHVIKPEHASSMLWQSAIMFLLALCGGYVVAVL